MNPIQEMVSAVDAEIAGGRREIQRRMFPYLPETPAPGGSDYIAPRKVNTKRDRAIDPRIASLQDAVLANYYGEEADRDMVMEMTGMHLQGALFADEGPEVEPPEPEVATPDGMTDAEVARIAKILTHWAHITV